MTYRELYLAAKKKLAAAGIDSPGVDAAALSERFFGLSRPALAVRGGEAPNHEEERCFLKALEERAGRRPLQYILGEWEFMGLALRVGEGVLVPREDTAVLVEALAESLKDLPTPRGLDLCAGSGAVALGLCSLSPGAEVACVELDPQAAGYLKENLARYPQYHIQAFREDVLPSSAPAGFPPNLDFVAANPPYIASEEIPELQAEVQREPKIALDGGRDGLTFYRAIAGNWAKLLRPGGILAVEIGESQGAAVAEIFQDCGLESIAVLRDLAGLDRVVMGKRPY